MTLDIENCKRLLMEKVHDGTNSEGFHFVDGDGLAVESEFGQMLMDAIETSKPKTILEIGTGRGYSTAWMMLALLKADLKSDLITVDWEERGTYHWDLAGIPLAALKVTRIKKDFALAIGDLPPQLDFVFHDSQHRYELITNDLNRIMGMMAPVSQIWIHDASRALSHELKSYFSTFEGWTYSDVPISCGMGIAKRQL